MFVFSVGLFGFFVQEDVHARLRCEILVHLVEFEQFLLRYLRLFGQSIPCVPLACGDALDAIHGAYGMTERSCVLRFHIFLLLSQAETVFVKVAQFIGFDDFDESFGIRGRCGIPARFESTCPSLIVEWIQVEESLVAVLLQKERVILVTVAHMLVFAEFLVFAIVIARHVWAIPVHAHLDAKVVVGLNGQIAGTGSTLEQCLC